MELTNLNELMLKTQQEFDVSDLGKDRMLPSSFKLQYPEFEGWPIEYQHYSAVLERGDLRIFFPNQWFYIGAYMTTYYRELSAYKEKVWSVLNIKNAEQAKIFRDLQNNKEKAEEAFANVGYVGDDKDWLVRFTWDYQWWGGGKTIDRADYYVSPILSVAKLVNASQTYIAEICKFLANNPESVNILKDEITNSDRLKSESVNSSSLPRQVIYYGAPGTGKSHTIKSNAVINEDNSRRTTFHPDCDYSTFVGCYKPITRELAAHHPKATLDELKAQAADIVSRPPGDKVNYIIDFVTKYAHQIKEIAENDPSIKSLNTLLYQTFGFSNDTYLAKVISKTLEIEPKDSEIVYEFQPQAFTEAYIEAWKDLDRPFFLIIEEINRGNCAQIFGDIFQLLDRDENGFSTYKITPDRDLQQYLAANMVEAATDDADIKTGKKMMLPRNLFIWATMNTSDQSLFPIDSAFKRRWEWRYVPIDTTDKGHYIKCGEGCYNWSEFIAAVNERIDSATGSEDKKLGYWFLARNGVNEISESQFVSKVVFYLWNDIYKDITRGNTIFTDSFKKFHNFFNLDGTVKTEVMADFLNGLGLESKPLPALSAPSDKEVKHVYHYNGKDYSGMTDLAVDFISDYINAHPDQSLESIRTDLNLLRPNLIPTENKNAREIMVRNSEPLFVTNLWDQDRFKAFMDAVNEKGLAQISED